MPHSPLPLKTPLEHHWNTTGTPPDLGRSAGQEYSRRPTPPAPRVAPKVRNSSIVSGRVAITRGFGSLRGLLDVFYDDGCGEGVPVNDPAEAFQGVTGSGRGGGEGGN